MIVNCDREGKGGTRVVRETRENVGCNYVDVCRCDMYVVFCCHFSRMFLLKRNCLYRVM